MRTISWWVSVVALFVVSACRLDLKGESADDTGEREDGEARSREDDTAEPGGRASNAGETGDGSPLSCATTAILGTAKEFKESIKDFSGAYHVTGHAIITGEITIAPGTVFIVDADSNLEFGWNSTRTTLTALGTADKPISFCSDKPVLGRWQGVRFAKGMTSDSVLQHAHIYDAGAGGAALLVDAPVTLVDVNVHGSKSEGVIASAFGDDSKNLTVQGTQAAAVVLTGQVAVDKFPVGSVFKDNADNTAHVRFREYNGGSVHLQNLGIPYVQDGAMLAYNVTLDFDPGIEYRFAIDTGLDVGWNSSQATLRVAGTEAAPVVFRGLTDKKGSWGGMAINKNVSSDSILSHVQFRHGGTKTAPLAVFAKVTLQDVTVSDCATAPVIGTALSAESMNFSVTGSDDAALASNMQSLTGVPRGGSFTGNARDVIEIGELSPFDSLGKSTIPNLGVPYFVTGDIAIGAGSDVTVEAGVEFIFESGTPYVFEIGWNSTEVAFFARGTMAQPIIFRSDKDDVGTWKGISIGRAVSTNSVLEYIDVRNAGLYTASQVTIQHSSFSKSPDFGIVKAEAIPTDYATTNTFTNNTQGDVGVQ